MQIFHVFVVWYRSERHIFGIYLLSFVGQEQSVFRHSIFSVFCRSGTGCLLDIDCQEAELGFYSVRNLKQYYYSVRKLNRDFYNFRKLKNDCHFYSVNKKLNWDFYSVRKLKRDFYCVRKLNRDCIKLLRHSNVTSKTSANWWYPIVLGSAYNMH